VDITLDKEQVVYAAGEDVRDAELIPVNIYRTVQLEQAYLAVNLGEGAASGVHPCCCQGDDQNQGQHERTG
jgi:hypothetical protein